MASSFDGLTVEQKVGQLFFIGIPGSAVDDVTRSLLNEVSPGGICLFARNIREADQTRELLDSVSQLLPANPFLSIDQEGGLVDRLRRIVTPMPAANKLRNAEDGRRLGQLIAEILRMLGFNMDFAPVVDVIDGERAQHPNGLFSRELGRSKSDVVSLGGAFLDELQAGGIVGCLKHFPGLGAARVDSHEELPIVETDESDLNETDLYPYQQLLARIHAVMVAHAAFPRHSLQERDESGKLLPSSLSKNFISTLLRDRLGFDGVVITDDLEMGAIVKNYGIGDACKMAINAGADMLAICADPQAIRDGYAAVLDAVNSDEIAEKRLDESLARIDALRKKLSTPTELDTERLAVISNEIADFVAELA